MDDSTSQAISGLLKSLGLDKWIPLALAFHFFASALDAAIPQPAPGSNWVPVRKILSLVALNFANAQNGQQPSTATWFQKIVIKLASGMPPPGPKPSISQRVVMLLASIVPEPKGRS